MRDIAALVDSVRTDLDEHDHLTRHYDVEPSDRVDVLRSDVEALLAIAQAHADCHNGWISVPSAVLDRARDGLVGSGGRQ